MLVMLWEEVCFEILIYKSKLPFVHKFEKDIYVNKGIFWIFDIF